MHGNCYFYIKLYVLRTAQCVLDRLIILSAISGNQRKKFQQKVQSDLSVTIKVEIQDWQY